LELIMSEIDYESESREITVTPAQLENISKLAEQQVELERDVSKAEENLKTLKRRLANIQELELPEAMIAAGCAGFTMKSGRSITIKEDLSASISESKREYVVGWLRERGHDDIVTTDIRASLGKGSGELAQKAAQMLIELGVVPSVNEGVNTSTFKALIRELRDEGEDIPYSELGVHPWKKAIIK
jgi:hypothetical protein